MTIQYDSNGIITQNLTEILDERENGLKPVMGEEFVIDKSTPIGNMELADANSELAIQELIAWLIPNMIDANTASGYFLDCICEKNRIYRRQPEFSKMTFVLNGIKDTTFNPGDITVSDSITGLYYNLDESCTLDKNGKCFAKFICEDYGEFRPAENSKLIIQTPIAGLDSVTIDFEHLNLVLGRLTESDEELRRRRMDSVQQTATTTLDSIKAVLYSVDGVKHVRYFENYTEKEDDRGIPMKSFEFIVDGGDEIEITDAIFLNRTVGTRAFGTTNILKQDSEGNVYEIGYTKAKEINIGINIKVDVKTLPSESWVATVKKALKDKFDEIQDIGYIVKDYNYYTVLTEFPEILDIKDIKFFDTEALEHTEYAQFSIGEKEIGKLNVNNITITTNKD